MSQLYIPKDYTPEIDYMESQRAIKKIKDFFQQELAYGLKLRRVSAPLFVAPETGRRGACGISGARIAAADGQYDQPVFLLSHDLQCRR